jgi:hypothetical protein
LAAKTGRTIQLKSGHIVADVKNIVQNTAN